MPIAPLRVWRKMEAEATGGTGALATHPPITAQSTRPTWPMSQDRAETATLVHVQEKNVIRQTGRWVRGTLGVCLQQPEPSMVCTPALSPGHRELPTPRLCSCPGLEGLPAKVLPCLLLTSPFKTHLLQPNPGSGWFSLPLCPS